MNGHPVIALSQARIQNVNRRAASVVLSLQYRQSLSDRQLSAMLAVRKVSQADARVKVFTPQRPELSASTIFC